MVSIRSPRAGAWSPAARFAIVAARRRPGRGLRRAGAVSTARRPPAWPPPPAAASRQHRRQRRAVGERRGGRSELRHRSGRAERLLRDRLRPAVQALRRVHQAVPERDLEHQAGPVHEPDDRDAAPAVGRQSARPDPPAVDGHARQGRAAQEPRRLRTAFGWDKWPAAQLAQNRVAEDGTRGSGSLYAMGLNYSLTGVFYNKELAAADRHDRAAQDASPSSRTCWPRPRTPGCCRSWRGTPRPAAAASPSRCRT